MTTITEWKYTRDTRNTTKYFYNKAQEKYSSEVKNVLYENPLTTFNVGEENSHFNFTDSYMNKFSKLQDLCKKSIDIGAQQNSNTGYCVQWQPHEKTHQYSEELNDAIEDVLGEVLPMVEKNFYNSKVAINYSLIYHSYVREQPEADNGTTWQWHLDNYPMESYKVIFYTTDVTETTAPFSYLVDADDNPIIMDTNANWIAPDDKPKRQELWGEFANEFKHTRIPISWINNQKENGAKEKAWVAKAGSFCVFTPNVAHKATVPYTAPREVISFTLRPTLNDNDTYWKNSPAFNRENLFNWYSSEDIDEETW
jgi:hypothetical protein